MATHIPVNVKLRPWHVRIRNSYRIFRGLGLGAGPALLEAWRMSRIGTWLDRRSKLWGKK